MNAREEHTKLLTRYQKLGLQLQENQSTKQLALEEVRKSVKRVIAEEKLLEKTEWLLDIEYDLLILQPKDVEQTEKLEELLGLSGDIRWGECVNLVSYAGYPRFHITLKTKLPELVQETGIVVDYAEIDKRIKMYQQKITELSAIKPN